MTVDTKFTYVCLDGFLKNWRKAWAGCFWCVAVTSSCSGCLLTETHPNITPFILFLQLVPVSWSVLPRNYQNWLIFQLRLILLLLQLRGMSSEISRHQIIRVQLNLKGNIKQGHNGHRTCSSVRSRRCLRRSSVVNVIMTASADVTRKSKVTDNFIEQR